MQALKPLITICGTTAVGKSRLAVELAEFVSRKLSAQAHFHGNSGRLEGDKGSDDGVVDPGLSSLNPGARIINADAMQVYAGLDIITNKIPLQEQKGVEHALLGFVEPGRQYVVGEWVQDAAAIIEKTHQEGKVPIIVGGTSYWIQHLLFPTSLPSAKPPTESTTGGVARAQPSPKLDEAMRDLPEDLHILYHTLPEQPPSAKTDPEPAFALHTLLSRLDPVMAKRWHWKDTRKVLRNLNIIAEYGRPASEVVVDTHATNATQRCRYDALIFWIYSDPSNLNERIDRRVDAMFDQGLLDEVHTLRKIKMSQPIEPGKTKEANGDDSDSEAIDFESGIYQAIGYKEFVTHLQMHPLPQDTESEAMKLFFEPALTQMKHNTRKYAQRQVKWIRNKLLPAVHANNAEQHQSGGSSGTKCCVYLLDATEVDQRWDTNVLKKAEEITEAFLTNAQPLPDPTTLSSHAQAMLKVPPKPTDPTAMLQARSKLTCPYCTLRPDQPVMLEEGEEWERHKRTRSHRRLEQRQNQDSNVFSMYARKRKEMPVNTTNSTEAATNTSTVS